MRNDLFLKCEKKNKYFNKYDKFDKFLWILTKKTLNCCITWVTLW
jgi:hypothetical protein